MKKGMKSVGISTGEFVKFNIDQSRVKSEKVPKFIRRLAGKIYVSKPVRKYLNGVAKRVSKNGWPTTLINGTKQDEFVMKIYYFL